MKSFFCLTSILILCTTISAKELPSSFEGNLIFLTPTLLEGKQLRMYTDTGGGWNAISQELVNIYGWPTSEKLSDGKTTTLVAMPQFLQAGSIPIGGLNNYMKGKLFAVPAARLDPYANDYDAFLGGRWHAEKIIQFDYINQAISHLRSLPKNLSQYDVINLGFQKSHDENYTTAFPSIEMVVSGHSHKMLFDTGAMAIPKPEYKKILNSEHLRIATSFIVASVFDDWKKNHPEWIVLERACQISDQDMILVPNLKIAEQSVGPVWFTRRADNNFHEFMSSMMDTKVDGALGGSAFKYLDIIVDYPSERAYIASGI
jgi:hypothetical protein